MPAYDYDVLLDSCYYFFCTGSVGPIGLGTSESRQLLGGRIMVVPFPRAPVT